ncbi:hypothetical protein HBH77_125820 [Parastagonospora nodorum]|nr:hypothetical protein HBH77_125820 [Parastagonospora nodorum]KAH5385827.1 hypothetical protein HBI33_077410 [Parastagonospora nodorum]KAH6129782.1 hypothetical protein HBI69_012990 [Parastagonospora nodorum]
MSASSKNAFYNVATKTDTGVYMPTYLQFDLNWKPFHDEGFELAKGLIIRYCPGHTPGLSILQVNMKDSGAWIFTTDQYIVKENYDSLANQRWFTRDHAAWSRSNQMIHSLQKLTNAKLILGRDREVLLQYKLAPEFYTQSPIHLSADLLISISMIQGGQVTRRNPSYSRRGGRHATLSGEPLLPPTTESRHRCHQTRYMLAVWNLDLCAASARSVRRNQGAGQGSAPVSTASIRTYYDGEYLETENDRPGRTHMRTTLNLCRTSEPSNRPIAPDDPRIALTSTAFVIYNHTNLSAARQFLLDFGLEPARESQDGKVLFFKGYGTEPFIYIARQSSSNTFGGASYEVSSRNELERATKTIPGCSAIEQLAAPGGGEYVKLIDPAGHIVLLVHGQTKSKSSPPSVTLKVTPTNLEFDDQKPRKGTFQRFDPGPAPVHRWGHYGVTYPQGAYQEMYDWYTGYLALAPSDVVYKDGKAIICFFHIDKGEEWSDHHAFFFKGVKDGQEVGVAHAAFETHDFDIQQLGHDWLTENMCLVARFSIIGSILAGSYWYVSSSIISCFQNAHDHREHYSDRDLVNSQTNVSHVQAGPQALKIWGPPVPSVF